MFIATIQVCLSSLSLLIYCSGNTLDMILTWVCYLRGTHLEVKQFNNYKSFESSAFGDFPTPCQINIQTTEYFSPFPLSQIIWTVVLVLYLRCLNSKGNSMRTMHVMCLGKPLRGSSTPVVAASVAIPKGRNKQNRHVSVSDRCYSTPLTTEVMPICPV